MLTSDHAAPIDLPGRVETRGIDLVPDGERHGRPRELFWVWLSANITYLYFVLGGTMLLLGLSLWQALAVVVAGNLCWLGVGALAVSGPPAGSPSVVVTRAMFGVRGNRLLSAGVGWLVAVAYEGVNLALGSLAGFALAEQLGLTATLPVKIAIVVAVAVATFSLSIYGHATIARVSPVVSGVLALFIVLLGVFVVGRADTGYQPQTPLHGTALIAAVGVGLTIIASVPLSWGTGADYSRYLPRDTSRSRVLWYTALGGLTPAVLIGALGVLAGTRIDMSDPQTAVAALVPGWFYPLFLLVVVLGSITNNVLTAYSSAFCLQALGVRASRARTVLIDAAVGGAIAAYALFAARFLDTLSTVLEFTVTFLGPSMAIYVADILLRRNRYDGPALHDETRGGPFWYDGGVNLAGLAAMVLGTAAALLCVTTTVWTGPVAAALGGTDLAWLAGPVVAALTYVLVARRYRA
ncbi:allantoin permease [Catellatospora sp. TT07R-123]|uniref:purine-cytosine permease family protein n=1 Tax=Catellatospora sp. TT07R-123 TaxID=2733863 RepID=UPI001B047028|nr:cytosine permease [Catellatospora sp. TT07R-123]GHJ47406.1 allantoin permease [Catellatospora sp. TT07R-123]